MKETETIIEPVTGGIDRNGLLVEGHGGLINEGFGGLRIGDGGTQI